jgi:hypothetical protein
VERVARDGKVVLKNGGLLACALFDEDRDSLLHLLEPAGISVVGTGEPAPAKRARRYGEPETLGQRQRPVCSRDRLTVGAGKELA